jgi:hypothetical protein
LIGLRCESSAVEQKKKPCVNWTKLLVVSLRGKELILLEVGFDAIYLGSLKIPAEFDGVTSDRLGKTGAKGCVL